MDVCRVLMFTTLVDPPTRRADDVGVQSGGRPAERPLVRGENGARRSEAPVGQLAVDRLEYGTFQGPGAAFASELEAKIKNFVFSPV